MGQKGGESIVAWRVKVTYQRMAITIAYGIDGGKFDPNSLQKACCVMTCELRLHILFYPCPKRFWHDTGMTLA